MESAARENDSRSITLEGYERVNEELELLCAKRRDGVAAWVRASEGFFDGDLAVAFKEQDRVEHRISQLEDILEKARVDGLSHEATAVIGARVRVRRENGRTAEYDLVEVAEADPAKSRVSIASPVGRALSGRAPGDIVVVQTPLGIAPMEIISVGSIAAAMAGA